MYDTLASACYSHWPVPCLTSSLAALVSADLFTANLVCAGTVMAKKGADAAKTLEQIARLADCSSQYEFMSLRRCAALLATTAHQLCLRRHSVLLEAVWDAASCQYG